ncbi:MAG TPA: hypothetical protein VNM47_07175 [Terriglobia bacterium]|nr:hypothetical protein [Terriglobia bacterium]
MAIEKNQNARPLAGQEDFSTLSGKSVRPTILTIIIIGPLGG